MCEEEAWALYGVFGRLALLVVILVVVAVGPEVEVRCEPVPRVF